MSNEERLDHKIICEIVENGSKVLDLGCGDGGLLRLLVEKNKALVQGIELDENAIHECVEKGVSVFHGDMESGLSGYPDDSFDYVILNQSMQETKNVEMVIDESLRIGKKVIVGVPNFAFIRARLRLFFLGKVPVTKSLPYRWYKTPNVHFLSLTDFVDFCRVKKIKILKRYYLGKKSIIRFLPNLFALNGLYTLSK